MCIFGGMSLDVVLVLVLIKFFEDVLCCVLCVVGKEVCWFFVLVGWLLFCVGEMLDLIYFVLFGLFGVFKVMCDGCSEFMGYICVGELVGEMVMFQGGVDIDGDGLLDNVFYFFFVYVLCDSEVLEIFCQGFQCISLVEFEILNVMI